MSVSRVNRADNDHASVHAAINRPALHRAAAAAAAAAAAIISAISN